MARILVTRAIPGPALARLAGGGHQVTILPGELPPDRATLLAAVADAEGLLCMLTERVDEELLAAAPQLRAIANYAVGTDNVDLAAAAARGIPVGNTPDVLTDATADLALALLLAVARRIPEAERAVREGTWTTWRADGWLGLELRGAQLAVVGPGRIGRATAQRARAFGMVVEQVGRDADLHAALGRADAVSLHVPLSDATRHLIDAAALAAMKPGAILVNTSRGGVVDQAALAAALHSGHLGGAGIDVMTPEPLPPDDPLLAAPNLIAVPHIGSATHAARAQMTRLCVENLLS
ncbi:MAG: D-glycerate dehydrogenase, partial [Actinobacteria bacterium]|nr:D-glycerate dehydrogenase [Actinomycetota bacterium]